MKDSFVSSGNAQKCISCKLSGSVTFLATAAFFYFTCKHVKPVYYIGVPSKSIILCNSGSGIDIILLQSVCSLWRIGIYHRFYNILIIHAIGIIGNNICNVLKFEKCCYYIGKQLLFI